ncbi:MAG TPA: dihydrofolate reductase [Azospirillaceae bacterium]|nr:dihydrofolate reductase [Azospirillaceae bacterium]
MTDTNAPRLALIAAVAENRVIGVGNRLPWRLKGDLKFFKETTMGKPIVMGRKTWESIGGKPLPGRTNLVVTRQDSYRAPGAVVCHDLKAAVAQGRLIAGADGAGEVMVIGGEKLFEYALREADRLYLTEVHARPIGDAFFPAFDRDDWREISRQDEPEQTLESGDLAPAYSIVVLDRA